MSRDRYIKTILQGSRKTFRERYELLSVIKNPYMERAEKCSELTDPYIFPKEGKQGEKLDTPYQSVGAEGVTNLSSRILNVLLPPNRPPFRFRIDRASVPEDEKQLIQTVEAGLSRAEREVMAHIETLGDRSVLAEAIPLLLVTGNVLLYERPDGLKLYNLRNYVVSRDARGEPLEIIVKEKLDPRLLPPDVANAVLSPSAYRTEDHTKPHEKGQYVTLYTQIRRTEKGNWSVKQECEGKLIGKAGSFPKDKCPWLPLRMYRVSGEDYGRGYVEKYLGDHRSLETLTKAVVEGAAACAKILFLVEPNSNTKIQDIAEAHNLQVLAGKADDVSTLQVQKAADFQVAKLMIDTLQQRLSRAYLLNSAIQRNAERVTAEEIRYMAQELESTLGGLYSIIADEFQRPYVTLRVEYMRQEKLIPFLDTNTVKLQIVTGVDALGRGQDATRLTQWVTTIMQTLGPQVALQYMKVGEFMKALASGIGIDDVSLIKSDEEMQAAMGEAQQQALLEKVAPNAVNQIGNLMGKAVDKGEITNG